MSVKVHVDELEALVGQELGASDWLQIDQQRIDVFATVTGDDQWIHTDPERAAESRFGATIAHGLLTLSLIPFFSSDVFQVAGVRSRINYGYERIRFPSPVLVGDRLRDRIVVSALSVVPSGVRVTLTHTIEIEGRDRPACVATGLVQLEGRTA